MPSSNQTIVLEPDLEELFARYTHAQKSRNSGEETAEVLLGDPMYGRRVHMPKGNVDVTILQDPKVALRYWHSWGIPTSKDAHRQRTEYFRDLAKRFSDEWNDVVRQANKIGILITGPYHDHQDVKERLRFLTHGSQMINDAAGLHEFLSKTRSPSFR